MCAQVRRRGAPGLPPRLPSFIHSYLTVLSLMSSCQSQYTCQYTYGIWLLEEDL